MPAYDIYEHLNKLREAIHELGKSPIGQSNRLQVSFDGLEAAIKHHFEDKTDAVKQFEAETARRLAPFYERLNNNS